MLTVGLVHGMSSVATADFYTRVNDRVNDLLGGHERPEIVMASVNFAVIERCVRTEAWDEMSDYLTSKTVALEAAGADFLVIGSNTGHVAADAVRAATSVPFLHIGDVLADAAADLGVSTVAVTGTRPVMEQAFYRRPLEGRGLRIVSASADDREFLHRIVFDELAHGIFTDQTRDRFTDIAAGLRRAGADAVVLGCTEYSLLVPDGRFRRQAGVEFGG